MINQLRVSCVTLFLYVSLLSVLMSACAITPNRFDINRHGVISGSVEVVSPPKLTLQYVEVLLRNRKSFLKDEAMRLYVKPNTIKNFVRILLRGEYVLSKVRIHTGSTIYTSENIPPTGFTLQSGEGLAVGKVRIILDDKQGLFATRILDKQIIVTGESEDTQAQYDVINASLAGVATLGLRDQLWVTTPLTINVQPMQNVPQFPEDDD